MKNGSARALWINVVGVAVAAVVAIFGLTRRIDEGVPDAWAKAPVKPQVTVLGEPSPLAADAGLDAGPNAEKDAGTGVEAGVPNDGSDAGAADPIDLAVAPD